MILSDIEIQSQQETTSEGIVQPFAYRQLQPASYDFTLGAEFAEMRKTILDPAADGIPADLYRHRTVAPTTGFLLEPGGFVLGHSAEVFKIPTHLAGAVNGKSSLARIGLQVHSTAGYVDPGFTGQVVLEISNLSPNPIILRPGMLIAQMIFYRMSALPMFRYGTEEAGSRYQGQRGAVGSRYTPMAESYPLSSHA